MKIAVVGTGYVGLVSGTCFAETGNHVTCIDIDERKVNKLKNKQITIYEPGLEVLFERNVRQGRLDFTTSLAEGIKGAKIIFLALPTPPGEDGSADLKYVLKVAAYLLFNVLILFKALNYSCSQALLKIQNPVGIQNDDISYGARIKWGDLGKQGGKNFGFKLSIA